MEFKITGTNVPVSNVYDNEGAHNQIKLMMQKGEILSIKFYTTKDNYPCTWIEAQPYKEGEEDVQLSVVKQIVDTQRVQWTPLFRERNSTNISGYKGYLKGKIHFRLPRTEELLDYLREHNQTI